MRKTALTLALVALIATGCSDDEENPASTAPTTGDVNNPPTTDPNSIQARADAVLIQNADLPGEWSPSRRFQARLTEEIDLGDRYAQCVGAGGEDTREAEAERSFQQGVTVDQQVAHEVVVSQTEDQARSDYAAYSGERAGNCIQSTVADLISQLLPEGSPAPTPTITSIPGFTAGTEEFGYRISATVAGLNVTTDMIGMHSGRINSLLQLTNTQGEPSTETRDAIVTKTRERMTAAATR